MNLKNGLNLNRVTLTTIKQKGHVTQHTIFFAWRGPLLRVEILRRPQSDNCLEFDKQQGDGIPLIIVGCTRLGTIYVCNNKNLQKT